ncbi:hypothetical protein CPB83DRAFT_594485 [Crepidotus variabilis]|uniref:DUF6699 domain-containing protein n=1 Tax=Crepidotus variabilis TaxID=179855 RepID=A0A9P6JKZ1_9AGAR|nr:hypothetical protein CPB83DRAFT_594485 [Crepidotus variabilis]
MPGLNANHSDSHRQSSGSHARVTSHRHGGHSTAHDSQNPSQNYKPPYSFHATTTAYGLNEPQWSVGPPPMRFEESPYGRVPLPPLPSINLHPLLYGGGDNMNRSQPIVWCVNQPSSSARISSSSAFGTAYHWRTLPAATSVASSTPPCSIIIRFASAPSFTRPIVVFPSNPHSGMITIGDVLNAVYSGLRQCATDVLCETMGLVPSLMTTQVVHGTNAAYSISSQGGTDDEVATHVAQCLSFRTKWAGLTPSPFERDVWILHTKSNANR